MVYAAIAFMFFVIITAVLVLPGTIAALPVLAGIFPLAILNIVGACVLFVHFSAARQDQTPRI